MTRNGEWITVNKDVDGNGISSGRAVAGPTAASSSLGDLNGDTCGGGSQWGVSSSYGWAVDDAGRKAVGTVYRDMDGDGILRGRRPGRDRAVHLGRQAQGMRLLNIANLPLAELPWIRAHAISGNGRVVLGTANFEHTYAWVNEGKAIDLTKRYGALNAYAASFDGHRVALTLVDIETYSGKGIGLWDYAKKGLTRIGAPRWCRDIPYVSFFEGDLCATMSPAETHRALWKAARRDLRHERRRLDSHRA